MKRWLIVMLASSALLFSAATASAIEFRPSGWINVGFFASNTALGSEGAFLNNESLTIMGNEFYKPIRHQFKVGYGLNMDFIASEQLSGSIQFRGADKRFGDYAVANEGDALPGHWNRYFFVHRAFIDWYVPNTPLNVRMGRWSESAKFFTVGINYLTTGSYPQDGVRVQSKINDNISVTGIWWRRQDYSFDDVDFFNWGRADQFSLQVPMNYYGVEISPWISYVYDKGSLFSGANSAWGVNDTTAYYATFDGSAFAPLDTNYPPFRNYDWGKSRVWMAGLGVRFATFSPFVVELDFSYSNLRLKDVNFYGTPEQGINAPNSFNRKGWVLGARISFATDYGTPTLLGWYSSGDDSNLSNGSERPVNVSGIRTGLYSLFGSDWHSRLELGEDTGFNAAGTWGVSLQLANASFVFGLEQSIALTYIRGTNNPLMARYQYNQLPGSDPLDMPLTVSPQKYMTKDDSAIALELHNSYKIYKELTVAFDLYHIWQRFDRDTWSLVSNPDYYGSDDQFVPRYTNDEGEPLSPKFRNTWGIGLSFHYAF